jgi:hypothetical protein
MPRLLELLGPPQGPLVWASVPFYQQNLLRQPGPNSRGLTGPLLDQARRQNLRILLAMEESDDPLVAQFCTSAP